MHHRAAPAAHALFGEDPVEQRAVLDIAFVEGDALRDGEAEPGRQVVDHANRPARILQSEHRVAADIAGAAGHKHGNLRPVHARALSTRMPRNHEQSHMRKRSWRVRARRL